MPRELGDERARYGRKGLREQLDDAIAWPAEHRFATGVILVVITGALLLAAVRGGVVDYRDLSAGDCLFVRTGTETTDPRPIGDERSVTEAILERRVEKASCSASHGHEVSAVVDLTALASPSSEMPVRCRDAFEGYVGRAQGGSIHTTFAMVPSPEDQAEGATLGLCLVARTDGQWMNHPARNSGE